MPTDTEVKTKPRSSVLTHLLHLHLLGMPASFLITGYLSNFHAGRLQFVFLCLFFQAACGLINFFILRDAFENFRLSWRENLMSLTVLIIASALAVFSFVISSQFPGLFDQRLIVMDMSLFPVFLGSMVLSTPGVLWMIGFLEKKEFSRSIENAGITRFIQRNRTGILLALLFLLTYFVFAQSLNFPAYFTRDRYFETDISDWIDRLTAHPTANEIRPVRAVHPAVMLILHPLTWLLSIPLNGDKLQAAFLLSALAGSGCVFMTWLIVKQRTGSTPYALISASLLGASASHLLLSAMLESYIFSALALISFCFLLQSGRISLKSTVPMGVVMFGITITNLAQACILYFLKLPRVKVMIQFVIAVVFTTLLLNVLQVQLYPYSKLLCDPSNLFEEQKYRSDFSETSWQFMGRVNLISRAVLLYGIVAPNPYILTEELGTDVPNFRTFKITLGGLHVAGYKGFADLVIKTWIALLGLAIILFLFHLLKSPKQTGFPVSLILCIGFNFGLHVLYGDDPMLYSPDWVYAVVLFASSVFEKWAYHKWLQVGLILFLGMMMYTNLGLIHQIMRVSLPFFSR